MLSVHKMGLIILTYLLRSLGTIHLGIVEVLYKCYWCYESLVLLSLGHHHHKKEFRDLVRGELTKQGLC